MRIVSTILILLISTASGMVNSAEAIIIAPSIIDNPNKDKKVIAIRGGMEGWSHASYMVDSSGKTKDIIVFDYSGKKRYADAMRRYVEKLTYSPASVNGIPTISHETMFLRHTMSGEGISGNSVSKRFLNNYQEVMNKLLAPNADFSRIEPMISELKDDLSKNLYEHALMAWLESMYFYKTKDFQQYMYQSRIIANLHAYIPIKILSKAIVNLYQSEVFYGYYLEAERTVQLMSKNGELDLSEELENDLMAKINTVMTSKEPTLITNGEIWPLGVWVLSLQKPELKIVNIQGKITSVELRCLSHHSKYNEGWDKGISVPKHAKSCTMLVLGDNATTFDFVQTETQ